jgi:hypothetical protein
MTISFRHSAGFGKRIEYYIVGLMLKQGLDVYLPVVDDDAIDAVVKRPDNRFVEVQIKARSKDCIFGDAALFAGLKHDYRPNYWFVFYAERMDTMWILSSHEFIAASHQNKQGKNSGSRTIWFNGKNSTLQSEHVKPQFVRFMTTDFNRIIFDDPDSHITKH